jgi:hypothetical protein
MNDDRGQALVLAVLALALAATTIVGLRAAQDRLLADVRERRAGEAAVEAAGATVADALAELAARARPSRSELEAIAADPLVVERSRAVADDLSAANGGPPIRDLTIGVGTRSLDITLWVGANRQRASIGAACCRR